MFAIWSIEGSRGGTIAMEGEKKKKKEGNEGKIVILSFFSIKIFSQ